MPKKGKGKQYLQKAIIVVGHITYELSENISFLPSQCLMKLTFPSLKYGLMYYTMY